MTYVPRIVRSPILILHSHLLELDNVVDDV